MAEQVGTPLKERGIVLYKDDRLAGLVQDRQELISGKRPADLKVRGLPADTGDEPGVIAADEEQKEPAEIGVPVESGEHHCLRCDDCGECCRMQGDAPAELDQHGTNHWPGRADK